jgi:Xaa-Pro aminopeptidase
MHPTYRHYYSDLSHNYLIGRPTTEQQKLADAYVRVADRLVSSLKAGSAIGQVWKAVSDELTSCGYMQYALPAFGHGIGIIGHEWYPAILDNDEFRDVVLEENVVEVAALVINVPKVGGMRLECPVRVTPSGGEMLTNTPLDMTVVPD